MARLCLGLVEYDPERIHGHVLSVSEIERLAETLAARTQAERLRMPGMEPRRADVLMAGAVVLEQTARAIGASHAVVNDRGTRFGVFYRAFG